LGDGQGCRRRVLMHASRASALHTGRRRGANDGGRGRSGIPVVHVLPTHIYAVVSRLHSAWSHRTGSGTTSALSRRGELLIASVWLQTRGSATVMVLLLLLLLLSGNLLLLLQLLLKFIIRLQVRYALPRRDLLLLDLLKLLLVLLGSIQSTETRRSLLVRISQPLRFLSYHIHTVFQNRIVSVH